MSKRTTYMAFISIAFVMVLAVAGSAWSRGIANVANTTHNLSTSAPFIWYVSDNVDEVCVFCHTPHGGSLTGPLWNHSLPTGFESTFTHYNSATLSSYLTGLSVSRNISDESLLCMSCHDGSVAVDHLINDPNSLNGAPITFNTFNTDVDIQGFPGFGPGARIGATQANPTTGTGDLTDDHPISFSYSSVLADGKYTAGGSHENELNPIVDAEADGIIFFGANNRVECSSCHDPHVDYVTQQFDYAPFLNMPNTGSALCLACHNK